MECHFSIQKWILALVVGLGLENIGQLGRQGLREISALCSVRKALVVRDSRSTPNGHRPDAAFQ
jgi:hypothetical protein